MEPNGNFFLTSEGILLIASLILFLSILASKAGNKFGLPSLLLFLGVGMFFGSDGLGIQFSDPQATQFIGMLALSIILFSGGMDTKFKEVRPVLKPALTLATLGVVLTTLVMGFAIYYLALWLAGTKAPLSLIESMLLAAIMSSTDSASVFSILRGKNITLKQKLGPLLEVESGSNDPMGYLLTIFLIGAIEMGDLSVGGAIWTLISQLAIGAAAGYGLGKLTIWILNKIKLGNAALYPILLLSMAFFAFAITTYLKGNGYLAVYIAGLVVGNTPFVHRKITTTFFDGFTWLWQIVMFLILGLLVNPHEVVEIAPFGLIIGVVMICLARPISVFISLLPYREISFKGKLFISWVGLRGAVPIIFATYPLIAGIPHAHLFFNIVFFMTIISLLVQGTTVVPLAKRLDLIEK